jgi:hypothetical protein
MPKWAVFSLALRSFKKKVAFSHKMVYNRKVYAISPSEKRSFDDEKAQYHSLGAT